MRNLLAAAGMVAAVSAFCSCGTVNHPGFSCYDFFGSIMCVKIGYFPAF